jgi:hypothetical protein
MVSIGQGVPRVVLGLTVAGHGAQKLLGWFGGPGISGFRDVARPSVRPGSSRRLKHRMGEDDEDRASCSALRADPA